MNIDKLETVNHKLYNLVKSIEIGLNERYHIEKSKVHIDEFNYYDSFVQFDFKYDFHFMINFHELEEIMNSGMSIETYISGLYFQIEQRYLKNTIKK